MCLLGGPKAYVKKADHVRFVYRTRSYEISQLKEVVGNNSGKFVYNFYVNNLFDNDAGEPGWILLATLKENMNEASEPYVIKGECMRRHFKRPEKTFPSLSDCYGSLLLSIFFSFLPTNEQPAGRPAPHRSKRCPILKMKRKICRH